MFPIFEKDDAQSVGGESPITLSFPKMWRPFQFVFWNVETASQRWSLLANMRYCK